MHNFVTRLFRDMPRIFIEIGSYLMDTESQNGTFFETLCTSFFHTRNLAELEHCRGVHGHGDGGFPAGMDLNVAGIPQRWVWQLRDSRGMDFFRQTPRGNGRQIRL